MKSEILKVGLVRRGCSPAGGAEAYLRRFADALVQAGDACVLFADAEWKDWPHEQVRVAGGEPRAFADAIEKAKPRERCDVLFSLERVWRCDVYRAGDGVHAAWLERRAAHEGVLRAKTRVVNRKHAALLELEHALFAQQGADRVIANSAMVRDEIVYFYNYPRALIDVIHNGVPPAVVPPEAREEVRRELGIDAGRYVVLFAGSGEQRKGLSFAVDAMDRANLSSPLLLVAGRCGVQRDSARVRFLGARRDMPRLLAACDAFLLPTLYDPFSNASIEALAAGLPVISTAANGCAEIIEPGVTGDVIGDPGDVAGLARAIERWASPALRAGARERLAAVAAQFTMEENVRTTLEVLWRTRHRSA